METKVRGTSGLITPYLTSLILPSSNLLSLTCCESLKIGWCSGQPAKLWMYLYQALREGDLLCD